MHDTLLAIVQWYGAIASLIAAAVVAMDLGRRPTGWAFVLFVTFSIALIAWGFLSGEATGIGVPNVLMLLINCVGVDQYLIRRKQPA